MNLQDSAAIRGTIVYCRYDPGADDASEALRIIEDGLLVIRAGRIVAIGAASDLLKELDAQAEVVDRRGKLIVPGFVDAHIHYAQTDIIASYGEKLLSWLERYTFPAEMRFADPEVARDTAAFFVSELLRNGTTAALVLGTVHAHSVDALFGEAQQRGMRLAAGKVLMDRNAPEALRDTAESGYRDSQALIERWHGCGRLSYAITPRFAPACSDAQLAAAGELACHYPDTYVHTHIAENVDEVAWVAELFPWSRDYLDVYDRYQLLRRGSVYAHGIHLSASEHQRITQAGAATVFCPTSNLFLGSGLFDYGRACCNRLTVGLATDVGAGTSFSMLETAAEAYKVSQLNGVALSAGRLLYLATLAGAETLNVDDRIGRLDIGYEADFVVLDPEATPLMARRNQHIDTTVDRLFMLMMMGDDRCVHSTWVQGVCQHHRDASD
ncbi:guanine deaminase [Salinisphaera sp. SPP-AMP-43]|uniref:guanine deaminase n=1 Tax=Salinisphaera sp. SPP-AMP-43 TaxID=3121288 RepID=UPI003C6E4185